MFFELAEGDLINVNHVALARPKADTDDQIELILTTGLTLVVTLAEDATQEEWLDALRKATKS